MKTIGIGLIGIAGFGGSYVGTLRDMPAARVTAICDLNLTAAQELASQCDGVQVVSDYHDMLRMPEVDAVFIATPHHLHYQMTMDALNSGKHVFCEKPLAISSRDAYEMATTARKLGKILSCHYNRRQAQEVKRMRHIAQQGLIGDIYQLNSRWMQRWTGFMVGENTGWRRSKALAGGGIFIGRGSHLIDAAWYILGKPKITSVYAVMHNRLMGFEVDDYATAILHCANGATISLECSYLMHIPGYEFKQEYELYGTNGGAYYCGTDTQAATYRMGKCNLHRGTWDDLSDQMDVATADQSGPSSIIGNFIDAVHARKEPVVTGEDAAYVTHLLEAGYESAQTGKAVTLS